ncbi:MAG: HAD family hydrolase [Oscillospiraceae bacterium]|nr:HAD family hydrolase [Oscillospiraceae bacterium]
MRKYEVIFFDWDGTAVLSRNTPADVAARFMAPLLASGVKLVILSGTSFKNIDGGKLPERFEREHLANLYFGLDRGANNYGFDKLGNIISIPGVLVGQNEIKKLHQVCFDFHMKLLENYALNTDIIFCRDNYCKIDIGSNICRGSKFFFTGNELELINVGLVSHGYAEGISGLITLAEALGREHGLTLRATTDAKYIELGFGTKSDNVDAILSHLEAAAGRRLDCCFWGDEFLEMDSGVYGSDAFMITEKTKAFGFFDVSEVEGKRPKQVQRVGGGVERFLSFLNDQACKTPRN